MTHAGRELVLSELRERIERLGGGSRRGRPRLAFGIPALDEHLPGEGLALGVLHEFAGAGPAFEHAAPPIAFVAGLLARLEGPVLWCLPRRDLFAPGLAKAGLGPERVIYAETYSERAVLPVMEEGLRCRGLAGVVGEVSRIGFDPSRRLQLAAEASGVTALVVRRWKGASEEALGHPTAAVTRWRISSVPSAYPSAPGLGRARWRVELLRCRGAEPSSWILDACNEKGRLALPCDLAHRPHPAQDRRATAG